MAEFVVAAALGELASITISEICQQVMQVVGFEKEVEKLANRLRLIEAVLVDAEQKQMKKSPAQSVWLDELKDKFYDIGDVLDEWNTGRLKQSQIEGGNGSPSASKKMKVWHFLSSCIEHRKIASNIKKLNDDLDIIARQNHSYDLDVTGSMGKQERKLTTSFDNDESEICGRFSEKNDLLSKLLGESGEAQQNPHIISIVGLGGIGKTTLAHFVCKHQNVVHNFNKIIWVCVSDPFDKFRVAKAILEGLNVSTSNLGELESLMKEINKSIVGKKFLLILDDVWTKDYGDFKPFYNCLKSGLHGSKILITTRNEKVANIVKSNHTIHIKELSKEEGCLMFEQIVFSDQVSETILKDIGRTIVDKCKGLPLAIKVIANLLCTKKTVQYWQRILNNEMWKIEDVKNGILAPLLLSFYDLPYEVKLCFLYCAIFPKDWNLNRHQLIFLWMSQGYFGLDQNVEMEIKGEECFDILAARSFFQELSEDKKFEDGNITCKMHDVVHDLALYLTRNEYLVAEDDDLEGGNINKIRHLMLINKKHERTPFFSLSLKKLRTLIINDVYVPPPFRQVPPKYFDVLTSLRALNLHKIEFKGIPANIKSLIHLRFLEIYDNGVIEELPETLCELFNLQTLKIEDCNKLERLPQEIGKLINLRHLMTRSCFKLSYTGRGIEKLKHLRTLTTFIVQGGGEGSSLECLGNLIHLRDLGIKGLGDVTNVDEVKNAKLSEKKNIFSLKLDFLRMIDDDRDEILGHNEALLKAVRPPPHLEILKIWYYRGNTICPNWIRLLTTLKRLTLAFCKKLEYLPPLGKLPDLESLDLFSISGIKRVSKEFLGIENGDASSSSSKVIFFPKLKSLRFCMIDLKEWDYGIDEEDVTIMPCLCSLKFRDCMSLRVVPEDLFRRPTLEELELQRSCSRVLEERYEEWKSRREP